MKNDNCKENNISNIKNIDKLNLIRMTITLNDGKNSLRGSSKSPLRKMK